VSNAMFTPGIEGLMSGQIDLDTAAIKVALVRGYTFSAAHKFVSDVTGASGTLNGTSAALSSVSITGGVLDASDTVIAATASANDHSLLVFQASAVTGGSDVASSSQRLICWLDTASDSSLPIQPGTGNVAVNWSNGSSKILKIG
jgi:hypothetical protein